MAKHDAPSTIYLKDYKTPDFTISETHLEFDLLDEYTLVRCELRLRRLNAQASDIVLDGQHLELLDIQLDGHRLSGSEYRCDDDTLTVFGVPEQFSLITQCKIFPKQNTSLEGLYRSRTMYCTQCEAEGFRKITYYLDRPDVLSVFTTKITADKDSFPVLLSNGNPVEDGTDANGRHWAKWHDPFPKPSYLFALVAGDLSCVSDSFQTVSGRSVELKLYVEQKDLDKCEHAMRSLKNAMRWDEQVYGREYDLDIFMIVAVDDFNMGAMENKGLNIFNTSCVLANSQTTTDDGFQRVEAVVAHEYFHNWSGNRVTCRDWFQLSLKEGFTVFRDAEFSADMGSRTVRRVENAQLMRAHQFAEDAGPMAHPVRPASFIEISNFYTLTVYEKGAEVVRMFHTLLGPEQFRQACDLYFDRHDGQAATIEDFVAAMSAVSGRDFTQFMNWYSQAGTPVVRVTTAYDAERGELTLALSQSCPTTPEATAAEKRPFLIPISMGLIGAQGALPIWLAEQDAPEPSESVILEMTEKEQTFTLKGLSEAPTVSLLRGFSAPIKLDWQRSVADLQRIIDFDPDGFARWDAAQELASQAIAGVNFPVNHALKALLKSFSRLLDQPELDPAMVALMLQLPPEAYLLEQQDIMDIDATIGARKAIAEALAEALQESFVAVFKRLKADLAGRANDVSATAIAQRSLKNCCLRYLMLIDHDVYQTLCLEQFNQASNMTEALAALRAMMHSDFTAIKAEREHMLDGFYQQWQDESLVVNQWLAVQASNPCDGALERVKALIEHPSFEINNPNKVRSVIGVFANQNLQHFHAVDGSGYVFLADQIIRLNATNPQIAARLLTPLTKWKRLDKPRSSHMKEQLQRIKNIDGLAKDLFEVVEKSLKD